MGSPTGIARWVVLGLLGWAMLAASPGAAQSMRLSTGFTPDPVVLQGETGGERAMNQLAPRCRGYVGANPDAVFDLDNEFGFLRMFVIAERPVNLTVRDASGEYHCSGSALEGAPREEGRFGRGRVEVWIGGDEPGGSVPYELRVTEFRSVTPATGAEERTVPIGGGAELGLAVTAHEGRNRDRRLRRGFLPDPRMDDGSSGGEIDVRRLGGECDGYVAEQPNHVLTLRDDFDYLRVQLGEIPGRATLLVRSPGGRWFCGHAESINSRVERDAWPAGEYRIWVGGLSRGVSDEYRICYTEARPREGRSRCGNPDLNIPLVVAQTPDEEDLEPSPDSAASAASDDE
ncbi:MAG: hypothetical protein AB8I08_27635 [Sandaracinaceae bacterium]